MSRLDRRQFLQYGSGFAGSLITPPFISVAHGQSVLPDDDDDDPGYDLDAPDTLAVDARFEAGLPKVPPRFVVDPQLLPPVGDQGTVGSCVSWAAGYGLTTFMLARKYQKDPTLAANQVSAAYLYATVRNAMASGCISDHDVLQDTCDEKKKKSSLGKGYTNIAMTLAILSKWGAVSTEECPHPKVMAGGQKVVSGALYDNVYAAWGATKAEPAMKILKGHMIRMKWEEPNDLNKLKAVLSRNEPLVFGTRFPKGWNRAKFDPSGTPWERYRDIATKKNGKPAGHAMLLIGYDDDMESAGGNKGAMLLQNSWGENWGMTWSDAFKRQYPNLPVKQNRGYAWVSYEAFRVLANKVFSIQV